MKKRQNFYWKVKATDLERQALQQLAQQEGLSSAEALRLCVRETAKSFNLWPPTPTPEAAHERL